MENLGVVSLKNRRLLNVFSTCGRSSEAIPPKEKVSTLWNVNKEENQGCKFFKFSSWFCPESFYRTRNVGLSNCFLVDCADSIVLQQFLYFLIPNNVWSVFIGITWGMYLVKFLRRMKTENLSLCLEWKGHLSVSAKFKKKKKNEAALLLVTATFNWRINFSITRCICGKDVAQRIYTFYRGNEWEIIFTSFGSL